MSTRYHGPENPKTPMKRSRFFLAIMGYVEIGLRPGSLALDWRTFRSLTYDLYPLKLV